MKSRTDWERISDRLSAAETNVFSLADFEDFLAVNRKECGLPKSTTPSSLVQMLLSRTKLRELHLDAPHYSPVVRYAWGDHVSPLSIALSLSRNDSYFSHGSALWIHSFGGDESKIFLNKEQSKKPRSSSPLSQEAIHTAFRRPQRRSKMFYQYEATTITMLNGKHTNRLGVENATAPSGEQLEVTCPERTLIDATVRPEYACGVASVLDAYRRAKHKVSAEKLIKLLSELDYVYPYHQCIGFYFEKAGYPESDLQLAIARGVRFDFYLAHNVREHEFDPKWRVFFPSPLTNTTHRS